MGRSLKLTIEQVDERLDKYGFERVGEYTGSANKITLKCKKGGHVIEKLFRGVIGSGCPECARQAQLKYSNEIIDDLLKPLGWTRLSNVTDSREKVNFLCDHQHSIWMSISMFVSGTRCKKCFIANCALLKGTTQEEAEESFASRGWKTFGLFYGYRIPMIAECPAGHTILKALSSLRRGTGCYICSRMVQWTEGQVDQWLSENTSYKRRSPFLGSNKHLTFLCGDCGHEWSTKWVKIHGKHSGCPECARRNHPNWNRNLTPEQREKMRRNKLDDTWRDAVYERDDYTCLCCGQKGGRLNAHHLYNVADYPEHRRDVSNGATLCRGCHAIGGDAHAFHRICKFRNNTPEQFHQWLYYARQCLALRDLAYDLPLAT